MANNGFGLKGSYSNHQSRSIKQLCSAVPTIDRAELRALILARVRLLGEEVDERVLRLTLKHLGEDTKQKEGNNE